MSTSVTLPVKKPKAPASNPKVINMITAAILAVKGCKCISLATIKKYITVKYKFDFEKNRQHTFAMLSYMMLRIVLVYELGIRERVNLVTSK